MQHCHSVLLLFTWGTDSIELYNIAVVRFKDSSLFVDRHDFRNARKLRLSPVRFKMRILSFLRSRPLSRPLVSLFNYITIYFSTRYEYFSDKREIGVVVSFQVTFKQAILLRRATCHFFHLEYQQQQQ